MQWRRNPKPDLAVLKLSKQVSEAAELGQIRAVAVVTVNPMLEVEYDCAGELDEVRKNLLVGALQRLILKISK